MVVALDQANGKEIWRDLGPFEAEHGFAAAHRRRRDAHRHQRSGWSFEHRRPRLPHGKTRCARAARRRPAIPPCLYQPTDGPAQLIINSWAHGISALDPATGTTIWELGLFRHRVVGSPTIASGLIVASGNRRRRQASVASARRSHAADQGRVGL